MSVTNFLRLTATAMVLLTVSIAAQAGNVYVPIDSSYKLVFADEFNGTALDTSKWTPSWFADANGNSLPVNSAELQNYSTSQVTVSGGNLHLNLIEKSTTVSGQTRRYTSGFIQSRGKFAISYGYIEARVYLPGANGQVHNWPAVWMVGQGNWPASGELDIMEGLSGQAMQTFHSSQGQQQAIPQGDYTGWHIFAAHWEPGRIRAYYDGKLIGTLTNGITADPEYLLINLATGSWGGQVHVPSEMLVDYVHVYSNASNAVAITPPANYGGAGHDGGGVTTNPTPVPTPVATPTPPVVVVPDQDANVLTVASPANNTNVSGTISISGNAGSSFVNVAAFDASDNYAKLSADVMPVNGKYVLSVDTSKMSAGVHRVSVIAFSAPPGQTGGSTAHVDLSLAVSAEPSSLQNLVANSGFENGATGYSSYGRVSIVTSGMHAGSRAAQIMGGTAGVEQVVRGLSPNTVYKLKAFVRHVSGNQSTIGAKDFGGSQVTRSTSSNAFTEISVQFKTGRNATSAKIFFYNSNGSGVVDDFILSKP